MIMPYLHFNGNCEEAFKFYAKCFGVKEEKIEIDRRDNNPKNPVIHAQVMLTDNSGISGNDHRYVNEVAGIQILALFKTREQVEEIIPKLSEGGAIVSGFNQYTPDDEAGGSEVLDKYGYTWFLCT